MVKRNIDNRLHLGSPIIRFTTIFRQWKGDVDLHETLSITFATPPSIIERNTRLNAQPTYGYSEKHYSSHVPQLLNAPVSDAFHQADESPCFQGSMRPSRYQECCWQADEQIAVHYTRLLICWSHSSGMRWWSSKFERQFHLWPITDVNIIAGYSRFVEAAILRTRL